MAKTAPKAAAPRSRRTPPTPPPSSPAAASQQTSADEAGAEGGDEYPKMVYSKDGKTNKIVNSREQEDALPKGKWVDAPPEE